MTDEADAIDGVRERAGAGEQHFLGRVVKPELLLQFDPARPMRGEDLGRLLGAQGAGVDEHLGQPIAVRQHEGDTPRVAAAAVGQSALVIVLPDAGLGLRVTDQEQAAHGRRLRDGAPPRKRPARKSRRASALAAAQERGRG